MNVMVCQVLRGMNGHILVFCDKLLFLSQKEVVLVYMFGLSFRYGTVSNFNQYKQDYVTLYVDTIRTLTQEVDGSRPFVVSSPSNGLQSELDGYIAEHPYSNLYGDGRKYLYDYYVHKIIRYALSVSSNIIAVVIILRRMLENRSTIWATTYSLKHSHLLHVHIEQ